MRALGDTVRVIRAKTQKEEASKAASKQGTEGFSRGRIPDERREPFGNTSERDGTRRFLRTARTGINRRSSVQGSKPKTSQRGYESSVPQLGISFDCRSKNSRLILTAATTLLLGPVTRCRAGRAAIHRDKHSQSWLEADGRRLLAQSTRRRPGTW